MGNGYNHHLHLNHQSLHFNHKGTFLPILCSKPSIKDVSLPKWQDKSGSCLSDDPLSPKISCMGQVKRKSRNIVGFPPAASHKLNLTTKNGCNNGTKYFKLKKLFSGKNLTASPAPTTTAASTNTTTSCRRKEVLENRTSGRHKHGDGKENFTSINIENMDPPLPVIKRVPKQGDKGGDGDTLWQRRSRGVALNSLQIQQVQLNRHQEPTRV